VARGGIIGLGIFLFFIAAIAYFWQLDSGYTYPLIHEVCISDLGQLAQYWFGGDEDTRKVCNHVKMVTYAIYGTGLIGIILIIVGSVKQGKKEDDDHEEKVVAKEETYEEILKQTITKEPPKEEPAKVTKPKEDSLLPKEGKKSNKSTVAGSIIAGSLFAVIILIFVIDWFPQTEIGNVQDERITEQKESIQTQKMQEEISELYSCSGGAGCYTDFVTRIVDGDTIYTKTLKIRLALTNTPEVNQGGASQATQFTEKLCPVGSMILIDQDDLQKVDNYGRILAKVYCGNKVLNSELLYSGHANILVQYCSTSEFSGEAWARDFGCSNFVQKGSPSEKVTAPKQNQCDPSYPALCIPSPPPDLDCGDVPYKNFRVSGSDPHRFDGDNDGIGCEISTYSPPPTTSKPTTQKTSCDPSYPDVCIPPYPPDLDCGEISYKNFRVVGSDPHRFDGDGDGIGCES